MNTFASELGMDFPIRLEAPHIIDMQKQVRQVGHFIGQ
jgi:hypothetical protein